MSRPHLDVFAPHGVGGASSRVRVYSWLRRVGLQATIHDYLGRTDASASSLLRRPHLLIGAELALRLPTFRDNVVVHREASPLSRGRLERTLLSGAQRGVYDFDDALQWDTGVGTARRLVPKPAKCLAAVQAASLVVAGNETLATWAAEHNADVRIIPSCVEPDDYLVRTDFEMRGPPRIGWLGSPRGESSLVLISDELLKVHAETGATLHVVSSGSRSLGALDAMVTRHEWSEEGARDMLPTWDVGIMPLTNTRFNAGKCAYKLLQYAAAAVPGLGTPLGASGGALTTLGGIAVARTEDWTDALMDLLTSASSFRGAMGGRARRAVSESYSFEKWEPELLRAWGVSS